MEFPLPEVGLVISYSYLWSDEAEAGHVEGRKNRPCAMVLVVKQAEDKAPVVTVVPITHSPHRNPEAAIEIPPAIKRHLGLDDQPSWIVLDDFNVFTWPGPGAEGPVPLRTATAQTLRSRHSQVLGTPASRTSRTHLA